MKMNEKKLRELQQHVVAAQACLKDLLNQDGGDEDEIDTDRGDIGGSEDDDETEGPDTARASLKMKLGKYKNA
jgi:hypothetical protein